MQTYIILSKFQNATPMEHGDFKDTVELVKNRIQESCPSLKWAESYIVLGSFDVVDIVEAEEPADVKKAVMIIREHGGSEVNSMTATPWKSFIESLASTN